MKTRCPPSLPRIRSAGWDQVRVLQISLPDQIEQADLLRMERGLQQCEDRQQTENDRMENGRDPVRFCRAFPGSTF